MFYYPSPVFRRNFIPKMRRRPPSLLLPIRHLIEIPHQQVLTCHVLVLVKEGMCSPHLARSKSHSIDPTSLPVPRSGLLACVPDERIMRFRSVEPYCTNFPTFSWIMCSVYKRQSFYLFYAVHTFTDIDLEEVLFSYKKLSLDFFKAAISAGLSTATFLFFPPASRTSLNASFNLSRASNRA